MHFWYHIVISLLQLSEIASSLFPSQVLFLIQLIKSINNNIHIHCDLLIDFILSFINIQPFLYRQYLISIIYAQQETWVRSLGWEDPLEEGMATHSSILAWRIPIDRGARWATVHGVTKSWT